MKRQPGLHFSCAKSVFNPFFVLHETFIKAMTFSVTLPVHIKSGPVSNQFQDLSISSTPYRERFNGKLSNSKL